MEVVMNLVKAMGSFGHQMVIGATDYNFFQSGIPIDVRHLILGRCDIVRWRWSWNLKRKLVPAIRQADIVHIHGLWEYPVWMGAKICVQLRRPYVLSPCGMLDPWSMTQKKWRKKIYMILAGQQIISRAASIHFTSKQEKARSLPAMGHVMKSFICPLGVDNALFEHVPETQVFRERFPSIGDDKVILFLGRIHYKKQPELLIRAFKLVLSKYPNSHLIIAGPGNATYVDSLKRLSFELQIGSKVLFTGMLTGDSKKETLSAADIYVLPSLQENFGIAVAEAMSVGCPVVISDAVNLAEDVMAFHTGIVCQNTSEAFADAILKLLMNERLRREMGENGRKMAKEKYDWSKTAQTLISKYREMLTCLNHCWPNY
ncbi:MAG: glycosyltransferase [Candidatus Omnitrophota bacterium]